MRIQKRGFVECLKSNFIPFNCCFVHLAWFSLTLLVYYLEFWDRILVLHCVDQHISACRRFCGFHLKGDKSAFSSGKFKLHNKYSLFMWSCLCLGFHVHDVNDVSDWGQSCWPGKPGIEQLSAAHWSEQQTEKPFSQTEGLKSWQSQMKMHQLMDKMWVWRAGTSRIAAWGMEASKARASAAVLGTGLGTGWMWQSWGSNCRESAEGETSAKGWAALCRMGNEAASRAQGTGNASKADSDQQHGMTSSLFPCRPGRGKEHAELKFREENTPQCL